MPEMEKSREGRYENLRDVKCSREGDTFECELDSFMVGESKTVTVDVVTSKGVDSHESVPVNDRGGNSQYIHFDDSPNHDGGTCRVHKERGATHGDTFLTCWTDDYRNESY